MAKQRTRVLMELEWVMEMVQGTIIQAQTFQGWTIRPFVVRRGGTNLESEPYRMGHR